LEEAMARCPHNNVQQFTEYCLDCGRNVYETDGEYYRYLKNLEKQQMRRSRSEEIERLEEWLGITHPGNKNNQTNDEDEGGPAGGW
jgi:hypothetical protein